MRRVTIIFLGFALTGALGCAADPVVEEEAAVEDVFVGSDGKADAVTASVTVKGTIAQGETITKQLTAGKYWGWKFVVTEPGVQFFRAASIAEGKRPVLRVYGPKAGTSWGKQLAKKEAPAGNELVELTVPATKPGTYLVVLAEYAKKSMAFELSYELPPAPEVLCTSTGGFWGAEEGVLGCSCAWDTGRIYWRPSLGGCVDATTAQAPCVASGGAWTDDASDAFYCVCPADQYFSADDGACRTVAALCQASAGQLEDNLVGGVGCVCAWNFTFMPTAGGCVDATVAERACTSSSGTWTDDASDAFYCDCRPADRYLAADSGACFAKWDLCEVTGGLLDQSGEEIYCQCPGPQSFIPAQGGCVGSPVAQYVCESSSGTWTDDAADAYYCACPAATAYDALEGTCG